MSYNVYSYTLIGLRVEWGKLATLLYRPVKRRGCAHEEREGEYCPLCGKRKWVMEQETHPDYCESEDEFFGYKIVSTLDMKHRTSETPVYLAAEISYLHVQDDKVLFFPFAGLYERLKKHQDEMWHKLKDTGLWDSGRFGIHTYLQESY